MKFRGSFCDGERIRLITGSKKQTEQEAKDCHNAEKEARKIIIYKRVRRSSPQTIFATLEPEIDEMKTQRTFLLLLFFALVSAARLPAFETPKTLKGIALVGKRTKAPVKNEAEPTMPTAHTVRKLEGWTVRVDNRLLQPPNEELGKRALRFLENKLADITVVVPKERLKKLQAVTIVLDLTHGKLRPMQYHPSAGWLRANGYSADLAKCVHIPRAADLPTRRNINEQPWVILHELAHAYHDQVLSFDNPRIKEAYAAYKKSGHGDKTLLYNGKRVRHYALTNPMEFFAEMTEAYFGVNDFFPFNRAELREAEPAIYTLLRDIWEAPAKGKP